MVPVDTPCRRHRYSFILSDKPMVYDNYHDTSVCHMADGKMPNYHQYKPDELCHHVFLLYDMGSVLGEVHNNSTFHIRERILIW